MSGDRWAYDVEVRGHLDPARAECLRTTSLRHTGEGTTAFRTEPLDQAALHGVLARLRDMGAELVRVTGR